MQHKYLGWQARERVLEVLDETVNDPSLKLDVFAFDLDEPEVVKRLFILIQQNRLRVILDNSATHIKAGCFEQQFDQKVRKICTDTGIKVKDVLFRGKFQSLSHSKIFIQKKSNKAVKVLTGSTNFTTNGLYINANHVIIFDDPKVTQLYDDVFNKSFGSKLMKDFKNTEPALNDQNISLPGMPDMTIRFSPHTREVADKYFAAIADRIAGKDHGAKSDLLFAIMNDRSKSTILDAVKKQVKSDKIFTYGIVDTAGKDYGVSLYKPKSKRGIRVAGKGTSYILPPPFHDVAHIPGISVHHKFIVVDFKTENAVVYCGSSNLAYTPEQKNGDNLIEIRDKDIVTAFAIEAIRLVDHFHWRSKENVAKIKNKPMHLDDLTDPKNMWYTSYYDPRDMHCLERQLFSKQ